MTTRAATAQGIRDLFFNDAVPSQAFAFELPEEHAVKLRTDADPSENGVLFIVCAALEIISTCCELRVSRGMAVFL